MKEIPQWQQDLVLDRMEKARTNPDLLLDWDKVSKTLGSDQHRTKSDIKKIKEFLSNRQTKKKFDAKNFSGKLKVNEDALVIQHRLRNEWN